MSQQIIQLMDVASSLPLFPASPSIRRPHFNPRISIKTLASSSSSSSYKGPRPQRDLVSDWVSNNDGLVRSLPIYVGGLSLLSVLVNRAFSGISPVADASSSQSRADILTLGLAVTNLLTGLVWLSIRPKDISPVVPKGVDCRRIDSTISQDATCELLWAWESFSSASCCRSLVIVYGGNCLLQIGVAAAVGSDPVIIDVPKLTQGSLYRNAMKSGKQSYLANLSLYPGKSELPFLPVDTQVLVNLYVILQPLSDKGIAIIGGDTIRGFNNLDQTWIASIADKLDSTLSKSLSIKI